MKILRLLPRPARMLALGATLAMALGGCAHYQWFKPDATEADYNQAIYACNTAAARTYPVVPSVQPVSPGYFTPGFTRCGYHGCWTGPGYYVPPAMGTVDINQGNRDQAASECMKAHGWQLIKVQQ